MWLHLTRSTQGESDLEVPAVVTADIDVDGIHRLLWVLNPNKLERVPA